MSHLRVVADNGETIEVGGLGLAGELRDLADRLDEEYTAPTRVIVIVESDEGLTRVLLGQEINGYELVGMLDQVKTWTIFNEE